MHLLAALRIDPTPAADLAAGLRGWLADIALWIVEALGPHHPISGFIAAQFKSDLRLARYNIKIAILMLALARHQAVIKPGGPQRPGNHAPGCCVRRSRMSAVRRLTRHLNHLCSGPLRRQIERQRRMLENLDHWVAKTLRRLQRNGVGLRRVMTRPPAIAHASNAPARPPHPSDTS